jgi:hypothetical protein
LCPTLPGIFAGVVIQLRAIANADVHLHGLLNDFESSIRDLKQDRSESKIKTCISKQMNVMEALGKKCPAVAGNTLGAICDQVGTWPHAKLGDALKNLYGFSCDYPGIRHGGTARNAVRAIELRDLIGVSIALAGLSRYITSGFDGERVYLEP